MPPKSLLKQVLRNVLHQKSAESMRQVDVNKPLPNPRPTSANSQPLSARSSQATLRDSEVASLETIDESGEREVSVEQVLGEMASVSRMPLPVVCGVTLTMLQMDGKCTDNLDGFEILLQQAELMMLSHLDTIETTLTLLEAMEKLSPHVEPMRKDVLVKKKWCERKLEKLRSIRKIGGGESEAEAGNDWGRET